MNKNVNLDVIYKVAVGLGDLNDKTAFVGGAVVGLYANDSAADEVRETYDIDISLEIISPARLEELRQILKAKGFKQSADDKIMCRFRYEDIKVDVMSTNEIGWAPGNRWFACGFKLLEKIIIKNKTINILPLSYFLASKFDAFHERGAKDPRTSKDFEDIIYILDNRTDIADIIINSPDDVKPYLKEELKQIISNIVLQEAILGNLNIETQTERFERIMNNLKKITDLI